MAGRTLRRGFVVAVALAASVAVQTPMAGADPSAADFGAAVEYGGSSVGRRPATEELEDGIGRSLDAIRTYDYWNTPFPTADDVWLRDTGRTLYLSVKSRLMNGTAVSWRSIADAAVGSTRYNEIVAWADKIRAFGAPVVFTFNHEPEAKGNLDLGNNADFIAAWRRIVSVFRQRGVTNATYAWIVTDYAFMVSDQRQAGRWYPGDDVVDAIGVDAYNWYQCRPTAPIPWTSLADIIEPMRRWAEAHPDEELLVAEYASTEDPARPGRKAQWIEDARRLFQQPGYERFTAVLYFDIQPSNFPNCAWPVDSSASSLTAFTAMGADAHYGGAAPPPPPPPPPPGIVFADSFDDGLGAWSSVNRVTVDAAQGTPAPSAKLTARSNAAYARRAFAAQASVCAAADVRIESVTGADMTVLRLRTADTAIGRVYLSANRTLMVRADVAGRTFTTTTTLPVGAWRELTLCGSIGAAGTWRLLVDGTQVGSWSADNGTVPFSVLQIGDNVAKSAVLWLDDVRVTSG